MSKAKKASDIDEPTDVGYTPKGLRAIEYELPLVLGNDPMAPLTARMMEGGCVICENYTGYESKVLGPVELDDLIDALTELRSKVFAS